MRKLFILTACLGLLACAESPDERARYTCDKALDGAWTATRMNECVKRVHDAEYETRHRVVQPYRDLPRERN